MPLVPKIEKTEVTIGDRTMASVGPARPVSRSMMTLVSVFDRTLGHLVTGHWKVVSDPADVVVHRRVTV